MLSWNKGGFVMNGNRILLDTNAIVFLLAGNKQIVNLLKEAEWVGISVISWIEFMAFSGLDKSDEQLFAEFLNRVEVVGLSSTDKQLVDRTIHFRREYGIKVPDAIIAATAVQRNATLLTADRDFRRIKELTEIGWSAEG